MRFFITVVILLLGVLGYLVQLNPTPVTLRLTDTAHLEVTLAALILVAIAFGGVLVLSALGMRELRRIYANWRVSRQRQAAGKVQELFTAAHRALFAHRTKEAVSALTRLLEINPHHVPSLLYFGTIKRQAGELAEAIRLHRRARSVDDQNLEVALVLGRELEDAEHPDEAVQLYLEILKADEANPAVLARLRDLYVKRDQWEDAHALQERIFKASRTGPEQDAARGVLCGIKYEIGRIWQAKGERDRARRAFRGAIKLDKMFLPAYMGWGEVILSEGRVRDAASLYEKAYAVIGDVILLHRLEDLYIEMGEPEQVLRLYHEAVRNDPDNHGLRFYLGKVYYRLEMLDEAQDVLSAIDASDEHFPDLHRLLGNLAQRQGNDQLAIEEFKRALGLKKRVIVPYYCPACDYHSIRWSGRCPRCKAWNTFSGSPILIKQQTERAISRVPW
ncbi:MAG: tetratricopeptide repeat protein [Nitrospirae bacterium]|nr:tetratricopeptide repeat protein [Nitrospirota bacterium]